MVARALLAALVLPAARAGQSFTPSAGFESKGATTACRATADSSAMCDESQTPCRNLYDVLTSMSIVDCDMVCATLAKTCTGYEYFTGQRCEIWKAPIVFTATVASTYTCYNNTNAPGSADGMLYPTFELGMSNFNFSMLTGNADVMQAVAAGVKSSVVSAFEATAAPSKVMAASGDVKVNIDTTAGKVMVGVVPQTFGRTPLMMYAVLRTGSDFKDQTTGVKDTLISSLKSALGNVPNIQTYLTSGTEAMVELSNRMLTTTVPTEPTMATTTMAADSMASTAAGTMAAGTTMKSGGSTMPGGSDTTTEPQSVNGAFGTGPQALAAAASVLAVALALF